MVWNCGSAGDVWANSSFVTHKWPSRMEDVDQLWRIFMDRLEKSDLELAVMVIWNIWLRRNELARFSE